MKSCPNCGNKFTGDEKFCCECGAKREPGSSGFLGMGMMGLEGMLYSPKGRHFHYSTSGMAFNSGCDYNIDETEDGKLKATKIRALIRRNPVLNG